MIVEIERKFLVKKIPENLDSYPHSEIRQGYLTSSEDSIELRVRKKNHDSFQTIKSGEGLVRTETEIPITDEQFEELWILSLGKRIEKVRYEVPYKQFIIEVDIYKGPLQKLITAEIEFSSTQESQDLELPDWLGNEITENNAFRNSNLASYGLPDVFSK